MTIDQKTLTFPTNIKFIFFNVDRMMKEKHASHRWGDDEG